MSKEQLVIKPKKNIAYIKTYSGQEINNREMSDLTIGVQGFLTPMVEVMKDKYMLIYDMKDSISLREFLAISILSKKIFGNLLSSIIEHIHTAEKFHFDKSLIQYSVDRIYIRTTDWRIMMMYVPLHPYAPFGSYCSLLSEIFGCAVFDANEDSSYIREFFEIIRSESDFSVYRLENYVDSLTITSVKKSVETFRCSFCNAEVRREDEKCPACGKSIGRFRILDNSEPATEYEAVPKIIYSEAAENMGIKIESDSQDYRNTVSGGSTALFCLQDRRNGEKVNVFSFPFSIGKLDNNALCISNARVSRKHAEIISVGNRVCIRDLNSTNGTYVDGKKIEAGLCVTLLHGSVIRFANEEYVVIMEE